MTAKSIAQEKSDIHFELHIDSYRQNHHRHNADDTEREGEVTRRRKRSCGGNKGENTFIESFKHSLTVIGWKMTLWMKAGSVAAH